MASNIRISTWNLCLGLGSKKDLVKNYILDNKIDICCVQETEIDTNFDVRLLTFPGYSIEVENNDFKRRVAIYISNRLSYTRRPELEQINNHLVIIDLEGHTNSRIITIYRSFKPQDGISPREKFESQLNLISAAFSNNCILLGDFNLDHSKKFNNTYMNKHLFAIFDNLLSHLGLFQHVNFPTWSRMINGTMKSSVLDHIYSNVPTLISNVQYINPTFGDHLLVMFDLLFSVEKYKIIWKRDWRFYSKERLLSMLNDLDWEINVPDVQESWNIFENKLINVIDTIVPYAKFHNNEVAKSNTNPKIKTLLNARKNCLKKYKLLPSDPLKTKIKNLDICIKNHFFHEKRKKVRRGILPGNSKTLWAAVRIAKDQNIESFPSVLYENGIKLTNVNVPDSVALFFDNKVKRLAQNTSIDPEIYDGYRKIHCNNSFFMNREDIIECVSSLKIKNSEGYDRIPQRIIKDGIDILIAPITSLFKSIYENKQIPDQWKVAKVCPIFKKGLKNEISNYRPISNLCAMSKVFEKLILKRLMELQALSKVDFTGKAQHGFKKQKSTATAGLLIQSIIAEHVDRNEFVGMASLDLSAAFDMVDIKLLVKRLVILGLPSDVVDLIKLWLEDRSFYVSIEGENSIMRELVRGTVQGSILGPILYAIYVTPLFDHHKLTNFADDNFIIRWNDDIPGLVVDLQASLKAITKWLRGSGLTVNESKTELCLFHRLDQPHITINLFGSEIKSLDFINVLGVLFDSKLQWSAHISKTILKANRALCAIRLIKNYFTKDELRTLLTANFYSILFYNSEIWHIPTINPHSKQLLLASSAKALKLCIKDHSILYSYENIHSLTKRATPQQLSTFKHAILLFKLYNNSMSTSDWVKLNFQQIITSRQTNFMIVQTRNYKIGNNLLCNRLTLLNNKIPLSWLSLPFERFKLNCKEKFLI